ncbi:MAG: Fic family protein [Lewinellaceae bacterium]|nr:Fic family protein [Lewinellaceae bacterium]
MEELLALLKNYQDLNLPEVVDYDKFNLYAITHHSTFLEGSTLTEIETQLLLEEGRTPKGKPLAHSLMVKDHHNALHFVLEKGRGRAAIKAALVREINARVLKNTGSVYKTALGEVDSSKGEYRLSNVRVGDRYFVAYNKVAPLTEQLCSRLNQKLAEVDTVESQLLLSFDAHFDLVSIHPFYDGNGRTARLLMNFIQAYFELPLSIVFSEDKVDYFEALEKTRKKEDLSFFRDFMRAQYVKYLKSEIEKYLDAQDQPRKGDGFSFVF